MPHEKIRPFDVFIFLEAFAMGAFWKECTLLRRGVSWLKGSVVRTGPIALEVLSILALRVPGIGEWLVALSPKSARPKSPTFESPNKLDNQKLKRVSLEGLVRMWWHLGAGHQKPWLSSSLPLVMRSETLGVNPPPWVSVCSTGKP